jgi:AhpC/TSA family
MSATSAPVAHDVGPRQPAPDLTVPLSELTGRLDDLHEQGIEVIAVSGETRARTERLASEWKLDRLPVAYGLTEGQMRNWGLFVSHGINDDEPALFSEPGLFLIAADGTVHYESILSMSRSRRSAVRCSYVARQANRAIPSDWLGPEMIGLGLSAVSPDTGVLQHGFHEFSPRMS